MNRDPDAGTHDDTAHPAAVAAEHRAHQLLDSLDDDARAVLAHAGRRINDLWAAEVLRRRDHVEASHAISAYCHETGWFQQHHIGHQEIERRRATVNGVVDQRLLAIRADPDRGEHAAAARRRRRRGAA